MRLEITIMAAMTIGLVWWIVWQSRVTSSFVIIYKKLTSIGGPLLTLFNGSKTFTSSE
jgi:hypothetical protein